MATNINSADIVPVKVLLGIAKRVRKVAADIAKQKNVPIRTANEIGILSPKVTQKQAEVSLTLSSKLLAYEYGSGVHGKKHAKYPITPKNAGALVFDGTNKFAGQTIITQLVMHPGVEKRPFLDPAKKQTRQQNLKDIKDASNKSIRLIIRGMARVI